MNIQLQKPGAYYNAGHAEFNVWAPLREKVELLLGDRVLSMRRDEMGYWHTRCDAKPGDRYRYRLDGKEAYPDPVSFMQPEGVHGASALVDSSGFPWTDGGWRGLPLGNMIIYELHTGCFSPTHDFDGIIARLDYLRDLGINTIELMPLAQFPGDRNWGYDGVYPFTVQDSYGGMDGFRRLVDAAHAREMAVIVDVVYNHMGPEGNYLRAFGPYFTQKYRTPWGEPLNFDDAWCDGVRNFFLQNARMWLEDHHVDGLRLDAVHAIWDFGAYHFMQQLKDIALDIEHRTDRKKVLIAEIDLNDPKYIFPRDKGGYGLDGQWTDEFHHALHVTLTGERQSYYSDFSGIGDLEKAFRQTYVYNGNYSAHRKRRFGAHAEQNPLDQFVVFAQNHDQIGNRALGDRLGATLSDDALKVAAAAVLFSPYVPMLFMGEEYGERNPFLYFISFGDEELVEAVRKGRRQEFQEADFADPQSEESFRRSCLSWDLKGDRARGLLDHYKQLIAFRKSRPAMQGTTRDSLIVHPVEGKLMRFERKSGHDRIVVWLYFGSSTQVVRYNGEERLRKIFDPTGNKGVSIIDAGAEITLLPYSVLVYEKE